MKTGITLDEAAIELARQKKTKIDYDVDTRRLHFAAGDDGAVLLEGLPIGPSPLRKTAHAQFASALSVPKAYYDRMRHDAPDLLAKNLNHWLEAEPKEKMVRTMDGYVRAFLSDRFRPLDNWDFAEAILPRLQTLGAEVKSIEITEDRFYLKAVAEAVTGEVRTGDIIQAGIVASNSEVGLGALKLEEMDYRLICLNGMIRAVATRRAHVGRSSGANDLIESAREYYRDSTRALEDKTLWAKVHDAATAMFSKERLEKRLRQYRNATELATSDPVASIREVSARFNMNEQESAGVLSHLIKGGDLSQWGIANAITRYSQDVDDYTRATEFESIGGDVIELKPTDWKTISAN